MLLPFILFVTGLFSVVLLLLLPTTLAITAANCLIRWLNLACGMILAMSRPRRPKIESSKSFSFLPVGQQASRNPVRPAAAVVKNIANDSKSSF